MKQILIYNIYLLWILSKINDKFQLNFFAGRVIYTNIMPINNDKLINNAIEDLTVNKINKFRLNPLIFFYCLLIFLLEFSRPLHLKFLIYLCRQDTSPRFGMQHQQDAVL